MNRLTSMLGPGGVTANFYYDGLGRQVARKVDGATTATLSVWDGWNLAAEYAAGAGSSPSDTFVYGAGGDLLKHGQNALPMAYFYPDALGSTSHVADTAGNLIEAYTYDLYGTPTVYNASGTVLPNGTAQGINHLFTGQRWYPQLGLYDNRNRLLKPDLGRFLQPDPIGFAGDPANLYRYVGNNPANWSDPFGLQAVRTKQHEGATAIYERINVTADLLFAGGGGGGGGGAGNVGPNGQGEPGITVDFAIDREGRHYDPNKNGLAVNGDSGQNTTDIIHISGTLPIQPGFPSPTAASAGSISTPAGHQPDYWDPFYRFLEAPPSAATAAYTQSGRNPTLVATAVIFTPLAVPQTTAPVIASGINLLGPTVRLGLTYTAQYIYYNPEKIVKAQEFGNRFGTQPTVYALQRLWEYLNPPPP
jgi:RHS repeat-associated protein